jgi:hypothetical protein
VWRYHRNELARIDDFGTLPKCREMALIACHQVVGPGGVGALKKYVVRRIFCNADSPRRRDSASPVFDQLQKLALKSFSDLQLPPAEDPSIFVKDGQRYVEVGRLGYGEQEDSSL